MTFEGITEDQMHIIIKNKSKNIFEIQKKSRNLNFTGQKFYP